MKKEIFRDLPIFFIRLGLGFVFFWFGIDKFIDPGLWIGWIPDSILSFVPIFPGTFIFLLGIVETILGILLIFGVLVRIVAFVSALHLLAIIFSLGFNDIVVRDIGLLTMALALAIEKKHSFCLDSFMRKR